MNGKNSASYSFDWNTLAVLNIKDFQRWIDFIFVLIEHIPVCCLLVGVLSVVLVNLYECRPSILSLSLYQSSITPVPTVTMRTSSFQRLLPIFAFLLWPWMSFNFWVRCFCSCVLFVVQDGFFGICLTETFTGVF